MRKAWLTWTMLGASALISVGCATYPDQAITRQIAEKMVSEGFTASPEHAKRLVQDKSQQICSKIGGADELTQAEADEVLKLARASIKYPASGKLVGDWKAGDKLAHDGAGDRISRGRVEKRKENGGLCQKRQ